MKTHTTLQIEFIIKRIILFLLVIQLNFMALSQEFEWVRGISSENNEIGNLIANDMEGNVYTLGSVLNKAYVLPNYMDSIESFPDLFTVYLMKLDSNGSILYKKRFYCEDINYGRSLTLDVDGNCYLTGMYNDSIHFDDSNPDAYLKKNGFGPYLVKLNSDGEFQWGVNLPDNATIVNIPNIPIIKVNSEGHVFCFHQFKDTANVSFINEDIMAISNGEEDIIGFEMDALGNLISHIQLGGTGSDYIADVAINHLNEIALFGVFDDIIDFDLNEGIELDTGNTAGFNQFLVKYDHEWNYMWSFSIDRVVNNYLTPLFCAFNSSNEITIFSRIWGDNNIDIDPSSAVVEVYSNSLWNSYYFAYVKYDNNGNYLMHMEHDINDATTTGTYIEPVTGVIDNDNNFIVCGTYKNIVDFDPSEEMYSFNSQGPQNGYMACYDTDFNLKWAISIGGWLTDKAIDCSIDNLGNVYLSGFFSYDDCDFDAGPDSVFLPIYDTDYDVYLVKYSYNTSFTTNNDHIENKRGSFIISPNPANDILNISLPFNYNEKNKITVDIYDKLGRKIQVIELENRNDNYYGELNVSQYKNGIYFIQLPGSQIKGQMFIKN